MLANHSKGIRAWHVFLSCSALLLVSPPPTDSQNSATRPRSPAASRKKGKSTMQVELVRTGGFAAPATRVAGTLIFDDAIAHVTSEGTGYHRDLPAPEADSLRAAVRQDPLDQVRSAPPGAAATPDSYQYRVTITENGKTRVITLPAEGAFIRWIQQETESIWQYRLQHRP